jgi:hypothetical protein
MNAAEVQALVREVMAEGASLAWWQSTVVLITTAVIAGFATLLASYFSKRGEIRALNENFKTAFDQLKENTRAVKDIEGQIALAYGKELEHYKWEKQVDLEFKKSVMPARLEALKSLWNFMEPLSPTASTPLSRVDRKELDSQLGRWYYANGNGIFLGIDAAAAYFGARGALRDEQISDKEIRTAFSRLRTQIKIDVGVYSPEEAKRQIGTPTDHAVHTTGAEATGAQPGAAGDAR